MVHASGEIARFSKFWSNIRVWRWATGALATLGFALFVAAPVGIYGALMYFDLRARQAAPAG